MTRAYRLLLEAGGQDAGRVEIANTPLAEARKFAEQVMSKNHQNLDAEIPSFDKNYEFARRLAQQGSTQRRDMPVIETEDVKGLQARLESGTIDVRGPWATDHASGRNPFPEGLSGDQAQQFLQDGLAMYDGNSSDDRVRCSMSGSRVGDLIPIQRQIYFDKAFTATAESGVSSTVNFLRNKSIFICSSDHHIIDGHHRWLSGVLLDPGMTVRIFVIDLPIRDLLPLTRAYGDAIGNRRNA